MAAWLAAGLTECLYSLQPGAAQCACCALCNTASPEQTLLRQRRASVEETGKHLPPGIQAPSPGISAIRARRTDDQNQTKSEAKRHEPAQFREKEELPKALALKGKVGQTGPEDRRRNLLRRFLGKPLPAGIEGRLR